MRAPIRALVFLAGAALLPAQNLTGVKAIAASGNTSFALLSDGTVCGWGEDHGEEEFLGGGQATPLRVSGLTDVVAISPNLALKVDGTVWAYWLGTNAVRVPGLGGVVAVARWGWFSNLALTGDGTVWVFGSPGWVNGKAEWPVYNPVTRVSGVSEIVAIAAGDRNGLALKRDGTVWMWGDNQDGSLGDGLPVVPLFSVAVPILSTPVQATGLSDVVAVAAGYGHSLALKSDGTVWAWGFNGHGQLGDGTTETRKTPFQVSGLTGVVKIAAGDAHSVAVKGDGTVWAWGSNVGGQLGDGTTTDRLSPVQVSSLSGTAAVAAGRYHSLALKEDGTLWAWGVDQFGQLGDAAEVPDPYAAPLGPVQVGGLTGVTKIAAGLTHSLALKSDGTLWAWGDNSVGELGDGTRRALDWPDRSTPVRVSGLSGVAAIAGGDGRSLAVTGDGAVWAWGSDTGIWGDGKPTYTSTPVPVSGLTGVVAIAASGSHSLALTGEGAVWEWGPAYWSTPVQVRGLIGVVAIAAGGAHSVAVKGDGTVWAWGDN
jgi:alpha-tubulin suppressor-like RCC1 family protein